MPPLAHQTGSVTAGSQCRGRAITALDNHRCAAVDSRPARGLQHPGSTHDQRPECCRCGVAASGCFAARSTQATSRTASELSSDAGTRRRSDQLRRLQTRELLGFVGLMLATALQVLVRRKKLRMTARVFIWSRPDSMRCRSWRCCLPGGCGRGVRATDKLLAELVAWVVAAGDAAGDPEQRATQG